MKQNKEYEVAIEHLKEELEISRINYEKMERSVRESRLKSVEVEEEVRNLTEMCEELRRESMRLK